MNSPRLTSFAPQFLVRDLARSIAFYQALGFVFGEPWEGFYAIGQRDGLELHLKAAPGDPAEREYRRAHEHLDAAAGVDGIEALYAHCVASGVTIRRPLMPTAWGTQDFYVEDADGYVIAFGGRPAMASAPQPPDGDARTFIALEERLADAWVQGDRQFIEALLADDWTVTDPSGRILTRQQVLDETFASTDRQIESMSVDELEVRLLGAVVVVTGRTRAVGSYRGQRAAVMLRFTDVFQLREGRWQVVASQGTMLTV